VREQDIYSLPEPDTQVGPNTNSKKRKAINKCRPQNQDQGTKRKGEIPSSNSVAPKRLQIKQNADRWTGLPSLHEQRSSGTNLKNNKSNKSGINKKERKPHKIWPEIEFGAFSIEQLGKIYKDEKARIDEARNAFLPYIGMNLEDKR